MKTKESFTPTLGYAKAKSLFANQDEKFAPARVDIDIATIRMLSYADLPKVGPARELPTNVLRVHPTAAAMTLNS